MKRIVACLMLVAGSALGLPQAFSQADDMAGGSAATDAARQTTSAVVPRIIKVSGKILDNTGYAVRGSIRLTFSFYADNKSTKVLWKETQPVQLDDSGRYTVLLGAASRSGVPLDIFTSGEARWLGVEPEGFPERPRVLLLSVPFALKAGDAETLGGKPASAYMLANGLGGAVAAVPMTAQASVVKPLDATACAAISSDGTASANQITKFSSACNIEGAAIYESNGLVGINNPSPAGTLDVAGNAFIRGLLQLTPLGVATAGSGFNSNALDLQASVFNGSSGQASVQDFQWMAEPANNGSSNPTATLNLLFGANGATPTESGLSIQSNGVINFAPGQTFPGQSSGAVTSVSTGAGLTGGPITSTGTIAIANGGVSNAMLANPSITIQTGTGLSGGGTVALGGTLTLTNTAQGSGTVTNVSTGAGLSGGPITNAGTIGIAAGGVTNTMLANPAINVQTGAGLSGGGTVPLGGTITLSSTATGTVTSVTTGAGLSGGTITKTGTIGVATGGITNAMLANPSITVNAGTGLSGGGTVGLGGAVTLNSTATGTVSSVAAGAGLSGGTITKTGTIGIATGGVTNAMLADPAITVTAGSGLSGGGKVALGGTITLTNTAQGTGTVTSVAAGAGLSGGTITKAGTIGIGTASVTNAMIANPAITVTAGTGLSGGGKVALGGTITLTNTAPSSGGTVKSIAAGTGLKGGTITGAGTISLDTAFTDARYMPIGGTLSGVLNVQGLVAQPTGTATPSKGYPGGPLDTEASVYNTTLARGINYLYRWEAEPTGNNSANTNATLNLLYGVPGSVLETGLSIARNGIIKFAPGQTFPGGGGGSITGVTAGVGLVGGGTTGNVTLSLPKTCAAGQVLVWSGTAWACGTNGVTALTAGTGLVGSATTGSVTLSLPKTCAKGQVMSWNGTAWACTTVSAGVAGRTGGIAFFSGSGTLSSTADPTNGQILIGSTGKSPVLGTLKAGANVTITDGPGTITISAASGGSGAPTLQFFTTGGGNTGGVSSAGVNVNSVWGFLLPYNVTTTELIVDVTKADKTANKYDIGIFNNSGVLIVDLGGVAGTTFAATPGFKTLKWKQASATLPAGRYYLGFTTDCKTNCAQIAAGPSFVSFAIAGSGGASAGGVLAKSIHPPADAWGSGNQPMVVVR